MQKIIIDLEKPMRDAVAEELEKYCRDVIKKILELRAGMGFWGG